MMSGRQKQTIGKILGLCLLFAPFATAQMNPQVPAAAPSKDHPLLEVDLRRYGYRGQPSGRRDNWSLSFGDDQNLLLGWTTLDNPDADKTSGYFTRAPSHLHVLLLNAGTGLKKYLQEWPVSSFYATISTVADEKFLACTGDAIRLLSNDFSLIRERPLPRVGPCTANQISPSGRFFSIESGIGTNYQRTLLEAESFEPVATWSKEAMNVHFTDSLLVGNCRPNFDVCIRGINQAWQAFHFPEMDEQVGHSRRIIIPFVVNDSTLVLTSHQDLAVVTVEGTLLFRLRLPIEYSFGSTATSAGGERFAIIETKMRGLTNEVLDMYAFSSDDQVVVYSLHERTAIYARKITGTSPWVPGIEHRNQLALSPDGSLLAILDEGILKVYHLPPPKL